MAKVAVLGLGAMGSRMAANLIKAGHQVAVWNRSPERADALVAAGARRAATPREACAGVEFALSMVRDDDASREVWLDRDEGGLEGLPPSAIGIESSTVTVGWVRSLAGEFQRRGIGFLDAPVSGSRPQADAAQLVFFVGGDAATVFRAEPILKAMGSTVQHAGAAGSGAIVKLAVNALLGIQIAAMGELVGFLRASGIDVTRALDILAATHVCSAVAKGAAANMLAANFAPLFPAELMEKDLGYLHATAESFGAALPVAERARSVFREAIDKGHGKDNMTSVVTLYEK